MSFLWNSVEAVSVIKGLEFRRAAVCVSRLTWTGSRRMTSFTIQIKTRLRVEEALSVSSSSGGHRVPPGLFSSLYGATQQGIERWDGGPDVFQFPPKSSFHRVRVLS